MIWWCWANKQHQVALSCDNAIIESKFSRLNQCQFRIIRKKEWLPLKKDDPLAAQGYPFCLKKKKRKATFSFLSTHRRVKTKWFYKKKKKLTCWEINKWCEQLENKGQVGESECVHEMMARYRYLCYPMMKRTWSSVIKKNNNKTLARPITQCVGHKL